MRDPPPVAPTATKRSGIPSARSCPVWRRAPGAGEQAALALGKETGYVPLAPMTLFACRMWALALATLATACGSSPAMRAAERADRGALRQALESRERFGGLSNDEAASLAAAVAARDVRTA